QRGLRHRVAPDEAEGVLDRLRRYVRFGQERGAEGVPEQEPGTLRPLPRVAGEGVVGHALAPPLGLVQRDPSEDAHLRARGPERGSEGPDQRQLDDPKIDPGDHEDAHAPSARAKTYADRSRTKATPARPRPRHASAASATA